MASSPGPSRITSPLHLVLAALLIFHPADSGLPRSGMWRHGFAVADMNGDRWPDLVFTSPRKEPGPPRIYLNDGKGRFARWTAAKFPALFFDYGAVAAADFDGNGTTDLAVGCHYLGVVVLHGDGRGTFTAAADGFAYPSAFSSRALTVTDWNADGRPDVAALSDGPRPLESVQLGVTVFENLGSAWMTARATTPDVLHGDSIAAGDVDGDGLADLVTASAVAGDARVLRLGSDGALARRGIETVLPVSVVRAVDLADFDGDGRDEIVIGYSASAPRAASLEVAASPSGARQLWMEDGATIEGVATGDLDGDGALDIVAALSDGRMLPFLGDERRFVISPSAWRRGCPASAVRIADLDGDGRGEIIATFAGEGGGCTTGGGIEVWRNTEGQAPRRRSTRH